MEPNEKLTATAKHIFGNVVVAVYCTEEDYKAIKLISDDYSIGYDTKPIRIEFT